MERDGMGRIDQAALARAVIDFNGMNSAKKVALADEIFVQQPNLLASILVLPKMGVSMLQLEVPLHVLLVAFQAMKRCNHGWPLISEDVQEGCMQRLTATMRFNEGVPNELAGQAMTRYAEEHAERFLLAYAYGYLAEHDLLRVRSDPEKYLLLAVLNLVECVAFVGARGRA